MRTCGKHKRVCGKCTYYGRETPQHGICYQDCCLNSVAKDEPACEYYETTPKPFEAKA